MILRRPAHLAATNPLDQLARAILAHRAACGDCDFCAGETPTDDPQPVHPETEQQHELRRAD